MMMMMTMNTPTIVVHGGAGNISDQSVPFAKEGVMRAADAGYEVLKNGGSALDAVQRAVEYMEDDPYFNAGRGGVLTFDGELEMDAIIMEGTKLQLGSVGCVKNIAHPIALARKIMENSPHNMLVGNGAMRFAAEQGIRTIPAYKLITQAAIDDLENHIEGKKTNGDAGLFGKGTVGAVVVDKSGRVAVATSTGGLTGKAPGRIGDTPLPGSGGYADDKIGAVSATGKGESIMRVCLAHRILSLMEQGKSAQDATEESLNYMGARVGDKAGAITVSNKGDIGIAFLSRRMAWAYKKGTGKTTLVKNVCKSLKEKKLDVKGFFTEEIRSGRERIGFDVVLLTGERAPLARVGSNGAVTKPCIGKYSVDVGSFESCVMPFLNSNGKKSILILDEIGKMELISSRFKEFVTKTISNGNNIIFATIPVMGTRPIPLVETIRNHDKTKLFTVTRENRNDLETTLVKFIVEAVAE
ncbi:hypothetical protein RUM43_007855 [Polyplax serrata]|uniref:L-asparaginase n=1 Tax=Polyplax serrata TaxID=468196 RepID=A0AAN8PNB5_POLSC